MSEHIWRIYKYTNIVTGMSYIGQTTQNVNDRAAKGKRYRKGIPFRNAIETYGWENFEQSILRLCTSQEEADFYEKYYIEKCNTVVPSGYNLQSGGGGLSFLGRMHDDNYKRVMSEKHSGENNPMYGVHRFGEKAPNYGRHWYNNGERTFYGFECPEGYVPGRLKRSTT